MGYGLTLVQTSQGVYALGGSDEDDNERTEVLQLDCPGDQISSCQWEQVGNLQIARSWHVSIPVPETFDICKTTTAISGTTKIQHDLKMILIRLSIMLLFSFSA